MGFINPWLLVGLAGISVPIIIHLLNRFRHKEVEWGAMELLRRAIVLRSRQVQMEDIILLILRCLAVALIALAMARPTIRGGAAGWFGRSSDVAMLVAIDGSYSMDYRPGVESRFGKAVQQAKEIFQTAEPGTPVTLVLLGERPRILLRNAGYTQQRVDKALAEAKPLPERLNLERCTETLAALVEELKAPRRECFIISDSQAATWAQISDVTRRSIERTANAAACYFVGTPADAGDNLAITRFELASGQERRGTIARYLAEVTNTGRATQVGVAVVLSANGQPVDQRAIETLPAGASRTVTLFTRFDRAGAVRLSAQLGRPDGLVTDNVRYAVANVRDIIRVLLVDGDSSDRPFKSETDFMAKALVPKAGQDSSLKVEKAVWPALPTSRLDDYDVVVLANVADIRTEQAQAIEAFVRQGGGLIITLGDKIDAKLFNARLRNDKVSLLPAELDQRLRYRPGAQQKMEGWAIRPAVEHRLSYVLGLMPEELLSEARVEELFSAKPIENARTIIELAETKAPLLVERELGQGRILLLTTTADRAWTNLAIHPLFPMLMHEAVGYIVSQSRPRSFVVGEPLVVPLPPSLSISGVTFRDPTGKETPVQVTQRQAVAAGSGAPKEAGAERIAQYRDPTQPGVYSLLLPDAGEPITLAVNVDPRESRLAGLETEALAGALKGVPIKLTGDWVDLAAEIRHARVGKELWRLLLGLGLVVLLVESFLAWYFARRIAARDEPALTPRGQALLKEEAKA